MKLPKLALTLAILSCFTRLGAQTADEIIEKHIKAIGGKEAWKNISSIHIETAVDNGGTPFTIELTVLQGKGYKSVVYLGGMTGYTIYTPAAGYNYFPWRGQQKPDAATAEDVSENEDNLDIQGPLIDYKEKKHTAEYVGMDEFEGTDCYKIRLTLRSGKVISYFIDPSNYFIIHTDTQTRANGRESEEGTNYSNYQKLPEGIWFPMNIDLAYKVKKVEVNIPVDENIFKVSDK